MYQEYLDKKKQFIFAHDDHLDYCGRIDHDREDGSLMVYPASFVRMIFTGTSLSAVVSNKKSYGTSHMGWILDGEQGVSTIADEGCTVIKIAENLKEGEHEVMFFKRMDSCHIVTFHGFEIDADATLKKAVCLENRRMEVYGDSVSAGEVSEAVHCCGQPDPKHDGEYSNSYYSYSWLTARKLNARLHDIAQGGIALFDGTGYFSMPDTRGMQYVYDKIQYYQDLSEPKEWDFTKYVPQVVVLAFGQNDNHPDDYMKEDYNSEKAKAWRKAYCEFIQTLLSKYPKAHIICKTTILCHDFSWDKAIEECVNTMASDQVHYFKYTNNSVGTPGHIRKPEAEKMADELSSYINQLNDTYHFW